MTQTFLFKRIMGPSQSCHTVQFGKLTLFNPAGVFLPARFFYGSDDNFMAGARSDQSVR